MIFDFITAALPWVMIGLFVAYYAGYASENIEKSKIGEAMGVGTCLGIAIGSFMHNIAFGIALGMLAGLIYGIKLDKNGDK
ncbi:MAG: hypothetical protein Q4B60_05085 [Erysipelotrichaceae bacterium]|nr:hypothetical protein [Erysipelotrichaceae bacterium]